MKQEEHFRNKLEICKLFIYDNFQQPAAAPVDSAAVAHRKAYHAALFEKIASEHARIGAEREAERAAFEATSEANHLGYDEQHYQH